MRLQEQIVQTTCDDQFLFEWALKGHKPGVLHGLLASSPADLSRSGETEPLLGASIHASEPSEMTIPGLRVRSHLEPLDPFCPKDANLVEQDCIAILDCVTAHKGRLQYPGIHLRHGSVDQYARIQVKSHLELYGEPESQSLRGQELQGNHHEEWEDHCGNRVVFVRHAPA